MHQESGAYIIYNLCRTNLPLPTILLYQPPTSHYFIGPTSHLPLPSQFYTIFIIQSKLAHGLLSFIRNLSHHKKVTFCGNLHQTVHYLNSLLTYLLYRVLQPSGYRSGVVLLLLLAIFCCRYPETTAGSLNRFISDVKSCLKERKECDRLCKEDNTCEYTRRLCKDLCLSAHRFCIKRCVLDEREH